MEDLVGHRLERHGDVLVGRPPGGSAARLLRLPPQQADAVVQALTAAAGEHVEALLDIGTAVNGDAVLVLPELPASLAELLVSGVTPGEAVTILVPLAATVARLHEVGVAHGALDVPVVRFDRRGAPVLTGFERSVRREVAGEPAFAAAEAADDAALRRLAATVLRVAGARADGLAAELATGALTTTALPDALFALAEPAPVRLSRPPAAELEPAPGPPGRLVPPAAEVPRSAAAHRPALLPVLSGAAFPSGALRRVLAGALRMLRTVRPRVWATAAASLALLAAALVLLPGHGAAGAAGPSTAATPSRAAGRAPVQHVAPSAAAIPAEPLAAARALLAERRRCLALGSRACLARIESAGSPVAIEDAAATAGAVEAVTVPEARLRLRSSSGGTAVLTAGDRTVLLLREPGGWRLRDAIGPPTTRSTARSEGGSR
jgi:eukaryotic-like serine/threonine-protein kinase